MIGALILKLALRGAMNDLNQRRKDKIVASYTDDALIKYPGKMSVSGIRKGKAAVQEFFDRYFDQFPRENCVLKESYIKNILALGPSNTIAIRWEKTITNKAGQTFENSGVTVMKVRWGKVVEMLEFYYDVETLQKMWGE
ncbi:MAG: nuclear transport factor 2 family protein [Chloroflexi bacterium]|nr:nuclear transport factor 2 family protein [Chloroflexota bacterium]